MECSKNVLQALRNEYNALGINLLGISDNELQNRINANIEGFKSVGYNDEVCSNMSELAEAYNTFKKRK